jgi:hypothetical protein
MESRKLQGWHADPFGVHEQRYFSAGTPTKLVRDGGAESYDEPPADEWSPADVAVVASTASATPAPARAGQPDSGYRDAVSPGRNPMGRSGLPATRRRAGLLYSTVALVAVVAVVVFVGVYGGFGSKGGGSHTGASGVDLAALVTRSAQKTLAQRTADVAIQGGYDIAGNQGDVRGNGAMDFAANAWTMKLGISTSVGALHVRIIENEIVTSQDTYVQTQGTVDGRSGAQFPGGGRWYVSPSAAPRDTPVSSLRLLEQQPARVVPMGSQSIGGLDCSEYTVTPAMQTPTVSVTIWVDQQRQLTCQLFVYLQFSTAGLVGPGIAPSTATEQFLMTFTRYGVPVTITPPAQSDTVSPSGATAAS